MSVQSTSIAILTCNKSSNLGPTLLWQFRPVA